MLQGYPWKWMEKNNLQRQPQADKKNNWVRVKILFFYNNFLLLYFYEISHVFKLRVFELFGIKITKW